MGKVQRDRSEEVFWHAEMVGRVPVTTISRLSLIAFIIVSFPNAFWRICDAGFIQWPSGAY
jgi:hypothetical protein